jgi:hypothetical protein
MDGLKGWQRADPGSEVKEQSQVPHNLPQIRAEKCNGHERGIRGYRRPCRELQKLGADGERFEGPLLWGCRAGLRVVSLCPGCPTSEGRPVVCSKSNSATTGASYEQWSSESRRLKRRGGCGLPRQDSHEERDTPDGQPPKEKPPI